MKTLTTGRKSFVVSLVSALLATAAVLVTGWANANEAPEVICIETEPTMVCSEPRDLEQGSGTVKVCEMVRQIVCETVVEVASK